MSHTSSHRAALAISEMVCHHCINHVRRTLEDLPGVRVEAVALGAATFTFDPTRTTPETAAATLGRAGYPTQIRATTPT